MFEEHSQADPQLARTAELMAEAGSLADVVSILTRTGRWIAGSDGIAVVLREDDVCAYVAEDAIEPLWKGRRLPLETCISGWAMLNRKTAVVPDIGTDPRIPISAYASKAIRSLVMVPIGAPEPVAALGAYWCAMVSGSIPQRCRASKPSPAKPRRPSPGCRGSAAPHRLPPNDGPAGRRRRSQGDRSRSLPW